MNVLPLHKKAVELARFEYGFMDHFTFVLRRKKVICIGQNQYRTHTFARRHKYKYPFIHSELDAVRNFPWPIKELSKCRVVNLRLDMAGHLTMAAPCEYCLPLLDMFGAKEIWYSNWKGEVVEL